MFPSGSTPVSLEAARCRNWLEYSRTFLKMQCGCQRFGPFCGLFCEARAMLVGGRVAEGLARADLLPARSQVRILPCRYPLPHRAAYNRAWSALWAG